MQTQQWTKAMRQTIHLTWASLKSRYRKTFAGFLWVLLNPLIMFGVQSIVFKQFLRLDVPNFYVFLLSGLLPWIFITQTISMGTPTLVVNAGLLKSFRFNPAVLVASVALDNFVNFLLSVLLIAVPFLVNAEQPAWGLLFAPLCLVPLLLGTLSITLFTSLLHVFFRDTNFVLGFAFSILFFLTPIFYPVDFVPEHYRWMIDFNPLYQLLRPIRLALYSPDPYEWVRPWFVSMAWALGLTALSYLFWRRKRNELYIQL